jgi:Metallo-beta-lactamase superfamily
VSVPKKPNECLRQLFADLQPSRELALSKGDMGEVTGTGTRELLGGPHRRGDHPRLYSNSDRRGGPMSTARRYLSLPASLVCALSLAHGQTVVKLDQEPACQTLQPASAGGPVPRNPNVLLLRSLGRANFEVAYRGRLLLLDAYYDNSRLPFGERFGIKESDITRADAIIVGHTHFDHFGDAPPIAKRTGAPIFVGPLPVKYLEFSRSKQRSNSGPDPKNTSPSRS